MDKNVGKQNRKNILNLKTVQQVCDKPRFREDSLCKSAFL